MFSTSAGISIDILGFLNKLYCGPSVLNAAVIITSFCVLLTNVSLSNFTSILETACLISVLILPLRSYFTKSDVSVSFSPLLFSTSVVIVFIPFIKTCVGIVFSVI